MFEDLDIQVQETLEDRVETGPVQFGNDWPGLFVRGEDALILRQAIQDVVRFLEPMDIEETRPLVRQVGLLVQLADALAATQL